MSTFYIFRTSAFLLIFVFASTLMGCGYKSAGNAAIDKQENIHSTQAPAVKEIRLGVGDVLNLLVWQNKDFSGSYKIDSNGNIFIPHVGELKAAGLSADKLRAEIITALEEYIIDPQVQLTVASYNSRRVYVLGEVKNPGIYQMGDTHTTIIAALTAAGGFTENASINNVVHLKKGLDKDDARILRMGSYLMSNHKHDAHLQNASLSGGDVIYVPSNFMAKVDGFFEHVAKIVSPIVNIERAITLEPLTVDVLDGKSIDNKILVIP